MVVRLAQGGHIMESVREAASPGDALLHLGHGPKDAHQMDQLENSCLPGQHVDSDPGSPITEPDSPVMETPPVLDATENGETHDLIKDSSPDSDSTQDDKPRGILKHNRSSPTKHVDFESVVEYIPYDDTIDETIGIEVVKEFAKRVVSYRELYRRQAEEEQERLKLEEEERLEEEEKLATLAKMKAAKEHLHKAKAKPSHDNHRPASPQGSKDAVHKDGTSSTTKQEKENAGELESPADVGKEVPTPHTVPKGPEGPPNTRGYLTSNSITARITIASNDESLTCVKFEPLIYESVGPLFDEANLTDHEDDSSYHSLLDFSEISVVDSLHNSDNLCRGNEQEVSPKSEPALEENFPNDSKAVCSQVTIPDVSQDQEIFIKPECSQQFFGEIDKLLGQTAESCVLKVEPPSNEPSPRVSPDRMPSPQDSPQTASPSRPSSPSNLEQEDSKGQAARASNSISGSNSIGSLNTVIEDSKCVTPEIFYPALEEPTVTPPQKYSSFTDLSLIKPTPRTPERRLSEFSLSPTSIRSPRTSPDRTLLALRLSPSRYSTHHFSSSDLPRISSSERRLSAGSKENLSENSRGRGSIPCVTISPSTSTNLLRPSYTSPRASPERNRLSRTKCSSTMHLAPDSYQSSYSRMRSRAPTM